MKASWKNQLAEFKVAACGEGERKEGSDYCFLMANLVEPLTLKTIYIYNLDTNKKLFKN